MDFLTGPQVAEALNITPRRVTFLARNGQIEGAFKPGGKRTSVWLIPRSEVERLASERGIELEIEEAAD